MPDSNALKAFGEELDKATIRGSTIIPGVVAAAVDRSGKLVYSKASGYMSVLPDAAPISLDSTFVLGSCTKIITAIAALQCVERGLITLDEPIDEYLPELAKQQIITPEATTAATSADANDGLPTPAGTKFHLTPAKTKITLHHLLTHTAGSSYPRMNPYIQAWKESRGEGTSAMNGNLLEEYTFPLVHDPGTSFAYGANYDWVSLLIGRLNKTKFGEFVQGSIFEPLGMNSSTFHLEQAEHVRQKLVTMSVRAGAEASGLTPGENGLPDPAQDELGGVGLYSSVPDFMKVLGDMISDKPVLLKPETIDLLFTPQFEVGGDPFETLNAFGTLAWKFFMSDPDFKMNHGLGGALTTHDAQVSGTPKGTIRWSGYSGPIWAANREKGLAWFYATQVLPFGDIESGKRAEAFGKAVFAE